MRKFGAGVPKLNTAETLCGADRLEDAPEALMWRQLLCNISYIALKFLEANGYSKLDNT